MRSVDDLDVAGRTVLLRADLNVPLDGSQITDDGRIRASLPVISKLAGQGARVAVLAQQSAAELRAERLAAARAARQGHLPDARVAAPPHPGRPRSPRPACPPPAAPTGQWPSRCARRGRC